jgi:hypothetical protein
MSKISKALFVGCFSVGLLSGVVVIGLQETFIRGPKIAETQTGHVVAHHGGLAAVLPVPRLFGH